MKSSGWFRVRVAVLLVFFMGFGISCQYEPALLDEYVQIPQRKWDADFRPEFTLHVEERGPYQLHVNLRHTPSYRYSNLFVRVQVRPVLENGLFDGPGEEPQRYELPLAEPDGRWLGTQSGGLYSYRVLVSDDFHFPDTGIYKIYLEQNMRDNPLEAVESAGLKIERAKGG